MKNLAWCLMALAVVSCQSNEADHGFGTRETPDEIVAPPKDPMDRFAGFYDIQRRNGDTAYSGFLGVIVDGDEAGYYTGPLLGTQNPAPRVRVSTPKSRTTLEIDGDTLRQKFSEDGKDVSVTYERVGDQMVVKSEVCEANQCETDLWVAIKP